MVGWRAKSRSLHIYIHYHRLKIIFQANQKRRKKKDFPILKHTFLLKKLKLFSQVSQVNTLLDMVPTMLGEWMVDDGSWAAGTDRNTLTGVPWLNGWRVLLSWATEEAGEGNT